MAVEVQPQVVEPGEGNPWVSRFPPRGKRSHRPPRKKALQISSRDSPSPGSGAAGSGGRERSQLPRPQRFPRRARARKRRAKRIPAPGRSLGSPVGRRSYFQACAARSRAHRRGRVRLAKYALSARQLPDRGRRPICRRPFGEHSLPRARAAAAVRSMPVQVTETGSPRQKSTAVRAGSASPLPAEAGKPV